MSSRFRESDWRKKRHFTREEITELMSLSSEDDLARLFEAARTARAAQFGNSIFLYGFLYFSTYCRNSCTFCQYRRENRSVERYRKSVAEIIESAKRMAVTGVHLIDLTMGEDPDFQGLGYSRLVELVRAVKKETRLPVMISPGVLDNAVISELAEEAGCDWVACYQETHNRDLYSVLRPDQDYDVRMATKKSAMHRGMLAEEGLLTGVGESLDDLVESIITMRDMEYDQVRVMTFVPQEGIPIAGSQIPSRELELRTIAVMRLIMPERLIPASLDIDGLDGLQARLDAGANVITSIVPPAEGFTGVVNRSLDIEEARRSVPHIAEALARSGFTIASQAQYANWMNYRRSSKQKTMPALQSDGCGYLHSSVQSLERPTHGIP